MRDIQGLLGQVQEDVRLDRRGGGKGRVEGILQEAAHHRPGSDARSRDFGIL